MDGLLWIDPHVESKDGGNHDDGLIGGILIAFTFFFSISLDDTQCNFIQIIHLPVT